METTDVEAGFQPAISVENLGLAVLAEQHLLRAVMYLVVSVLLSIFLYRKFEIPAKKASRSLLLRLGRGDRASRLKSQ